MHHGPDGDYNGYPPLRAYLGYTDPSDVEVENDTMIDPYGLFTSEEPYLLPRYRCGGNFYRAAYWTQNGKIYLTQVYKGGGYKTAGIKAVATLKEGLYKISGDGSKESPWEISLTPQKPKYSIYQKSEHDENYVYKDVTTQLSAVVNSPDRANPYKPTAELSLIRGDDENIKLTVKSSDNGTFYEHKIIAKVGTEPKEYISNEEPTTVTSGIKGYIYTINKEEKISQIEDKEIKAKQGEDIIIPRKYTNEGYYLHIQAIDYADNESEILHMPLDYVYRDLSLYKVYQEPTNINDIGVAETAGWNYINLDWTKIEIDKDDPSEIPEVCFVVDCSKSMKTNGRYIKVRNAMTMLVNRLFDYYPTIKISQVRFWRSTAVDIQGSSDREAVLAAIQKIGYIKKTYAEKGINKAIEVLSQSTQKNKIIIVFADGNANDTPNNALAKAKQLGIKTISIMVDYGGTGGYSNSDIVESVGTGDDTFYDKIAYGIYQEIQDTMVARYYIYRKAEGERVFSQVNIDAIKEPQHSEITATDKSGPLRPIITLSESANRDGKINLNIWTEDKGTAYEFYVKFVHPRTQKELYSNSVVQEIKTGVKGYSWCITTNATTDPGNEIKELTTSFEKEDVGKYLHIRAIDYANNLGEVCHIKLETSRYISWEELDKTKELFCIQHGVTIPAREDERHLNTVVTAGSGEYRISEIVESPKTGDRIGIRFVENTTTNIYGSNILKSYTLGEYRISPNTPIRKPGKEGNATEQEAYILNHLAQNGSLESAVQKAVYHTDISKGYVGWDWEDTPESLALLAEANAYAAYKRKGYGFSNEKLDTAVYMDTQYEDVIIGPFVLNYEPQGMKYKDKVLYFARIIGMKVYNQNNEVISELNINGINIGNIEAEIIYTQEASSNKRNEQIFTREQYKYPVGEEEFYIKLKYKKELEDVTNINKIEFIHQQYNADAQYNVLEGTYNEVEWHPNEIERNLSDVIWCREVEAGADSCIHNKTLPNHIVGCYFYLTAKVNGTSRKTSQTLIDVLWVKCGYETLVQVLEPGSGEGNNSNSDEYTNEEYRLVMNITGNVWEDGMEDKNNGIKENAEQGIQKVKVTIYQVNQYGERTNKKYSTYTDNVGNYELLDVPKGIYDLEFQYNGQIYKSTKLLVNGTPENYKKDYTHLQYKNNSVSEETQEARRELNSAYEEIAGNSTAIGGRGEIELEYIEDMNKSLIQTTEDGYTKEKYTIKAITSSNNIYFPISKRIEIAGEKYIKIVDSKDVNFGLATRYTTDNSLKMDLYETIFTIKGVEQRYIFLQKNIRDINSNTSDSDIQSYTQEVNYADYNWKVEDLLNKVPEGPEAAEIKKRILESLIGKELSTNKTEQQQITEVKEATELEAYLDYIIVIRNAGEKDKIQISELANYYSKEDLTYLSEYRDIEIKSSWAQVKYDDIKEGENINKTDKYEVVWTETSKYTYSKDKSSYSDEYNEIYTTSLDSKELQIQKGEYLEVHITFKVKKDENGKLKLDENNAGKASMTEINGYKTYYIQDDSIAGLIDIDSQPGNANPKEERGNNEDDESKAPELKLRFAELTNTDGSIDENTEDGNDEDSNNDISKDENGNIVGYGNVVEGNVWEDSKNSEYVQKLVNNQTISDGIRQDNEELIPNIKVELIEYFKHPTDSNKDVYLTIAEQKTRTVISLSNGKELGGGYSFINLPTGTYKTRFTYGLEEQLMIDAKYNGQDYQGIATSDINKYEEVMKSYEDVEVMFLIDVSGSMAGEDNKIVKELATNIADGIYTNLPYVKIGIAKFNNVAEVLVKPQQEKNNVISAIANLGSDNETAIGYGIESVINTYSVDVKEKLMIVLTDSKETVQNIEQVIKTMESAVDKQKIELISIVTSEETEIFGTDEKPRRGIVYAIKNLNQVEESTEIMKQICNNILEDAEIETRRSSAKDIEGNLENPEKGTRAYGIKEYQVMDLEKAQRLDIESIVNLQDLEEKRTKIKELADETFMMAESKLMTFRANNVKTSQIHEINLALMERPKASLVIESKIKSIKVILADNTVLIDTAKGLSKNVMGLDVPDADVSIFMDEEIMHGANLIVEYQITIRNEGEVDRLSNYITGASDSTVMTRAKLIFNYVSKNMLYRDEGTTWDTVEINDITKTKITDETVNYLEENNMQIFETDSFGIELYPKDSIEVQKGEQQYEKIFAVTLSKLITPENKDSDLEFDSSMEIVERENTAGRRSETEITGNYAAGTKPTEADSIRERRIIITKPWGGNRSTQYVIIALAALTATAGGIWLLKKKQKKKEE